MTSRMMKKAWVSSCRLCGSNGLSICCPVMSSGIAERDWREKRGWQGQGSHVTRVSLFAQLRSSNLLERVFSL